MSKTLLMAVAVALGLSGCVSVNTNFPTPLREDLTYNWNVVGVEATAPHTLTTTDRNGQAPNVDIIWYGDGPGDVYAQVEGVIEEALQAAADRMQTSIKGSRNVILRAEVTQFHSLTPRARGNIGGIHNTDLILTVVDANTREVLAGPAAIEADLKAYGGAAARESEARGETMRSRIVERVSLVVAEYLGVPIAEVEVGSVRMLGR